MKHYLLTRLNPAAFPPASFVFGFLLGAAFLILSLLAIKLEFAKSIVFTFIVLTLLLFLGALGATIYSSRKQQFFETLIDPLIEPIKDLSGEEISRLWDSENEERLDFLKQWTIRIAPNIRGVAAALAGLFSRMLAFRLLFALLGITVSMAIFLATFLQVERMEEQNRLQSLESISAYESLARELRNSITELEYSVEASSRVSRLLQEVLNSSSLLDDGGACLQATNPAGKAITSFYMLNPAYRRKYVFDRKCVFEIANFLAHLSGVLISKEYTSIELPRGTALNRLTPTSYLNYLSLACGTAEEPSFAVIASWQKMLDLERVFGIRKSQLNNRNLAPEASNGLTNAIIEFQNGKIHQDRSKDLTSKQSSSLHEVAIDVNNIVESTIQYIEEAIAQCQRKAVTDRQFLTEMNLEKRELRKMMNDVRQSR